MIDYQEHKLYEAPSHDVERVAAFEGLDDVNAKISMKIISRIRDSTEF
jgi:hypothetical protein